MNPVQEITKTFLFDRKYENTHRDHRLFRIRPRLWTRPTPPTSNNLQGPGTNEPHHFHSKATLLFLCETRPLEHRTVTSGGWWNASRRMGERHPPACRAMQYCRQQLCFTTLLRSFLSLTEADRRLLGKQRWAGASQRTAFPVNASPRQQSAKRQTSAAAAVNRWQKNPSKLQHQRKQAHQWWTRPSRCTCKRAETTWNSQQRWLYWGSSSKDVLISQSGPDFRATLKGLTTCPRPPRPEPAHREIPFLHAPPGTAASENPQRCPVRAPSLTKDGGERKTLSTGANCLCRLSL